MKDPVYVESMEDWTLDNGWLVGMKTLPETEEKYS